MFTACTEKLCGPSATVALLNKPEKLGPISVARTVPSTSKLIFAIPEIASVADAEIVIWPFSICPAVIPLSTATLGGAVSTTNEPESVPKIPALFCTDAVIVCVPSLSDADGVNVMKLDPAFGRTDTPSKVRLAVAGAMPVNASLKLMEMVGVALFTNDPFAGEFICRTGGVVSGEMKLLVNAFVCKLPPNETAPFTSTL